MKEQEEQEKQGRYIADVDEGEFYREPASGVYVDRAAVWQDAEGRLTLATGDDGFGLHLDPNDLEQFITFLRASMSKAFE